MPPSALDQMSLEDLMALRDQLQTQRTDMQQRIVAKSHELGVDPALSLSVAHQESLFNPNAVSPTGVQGILQVTVPTGQRFGQTAQNRFDPDVSIHAGVSELKRLLDASGGGVRKALKGYGDPQQANYADLVLAHYPHYAQMQAPSQTQAQRLDQMSLEELVQLRDRLRGKQAAPPAAALPEVVPSADPTQPATLRYPGPQGEPSPVQEPIDIIKESPAAVPTPQGFPMEGNLLSDVSQIAQEGMAPSGTLAHAATETGKEAAAMGIQGLTTSAGATLGALTTPVTGVFGPALGAGLGSYYGHRLAQRFGLTPGEREVLPRTAQDYLALLAPMAPAVTEVPGALLR